jgi:DNA-directed RNA polymerase alpha subunit
MSKFEDTDLSIRATNVLKGCGINTVEDLNGKTIEDLRAYKSMTKKTIEELMVLELI